MRKRFLSFILAICLLIPCTFALTACTGGKNDEPVNLTGKTLVVKEITNMNWEKISLSATYMDTTDNNRLYSVEITGQNAFENEEFFNIVKALVEEPSVTTIEELKPHVKWLAEVNLRAEIGMFKFSEDGSKVDIYDYYDSDMESTMYSHTVRKETTESGDLYTLLSDSGLTTYKKFLACKNGDILPGEAPTAPNVRLNLYHLEQEITLTAIDDSGKTKKVSLENCDSANLYFTVDFSFCTLN